MLAPAILWALALFGPPASATEDTLLDRVTAYARKYESQMPDFICTRLTRRSEQKSNGEWKLLDTVEDEVAYSGGRERMRTISVNGKPAKAGARVSGFNSNGEFGTSMTNIFAPERHAQLTFHSPNEVEFRVARINSVYTIHKDGLGSAVGFHGTLTVREDGAILKLHLETEPVPELALSEATQEIEFADTAISGRHYLLASRAMALIREKKTLLRREMTFRNYRKYDADSTLNFSIPK